MLESAEKNIQSAKQLLREIMGTKNQPSAVAEKARSVASGVAVGTAGGKIIEGVFDGQNMMGPDGKKYPVPANYASKSKLVEGDVLKLTIADDGSFIYKQIGPVERKRMRGTLLQDDDTGQYAVLSGGNSYKVLSASITYFKGEVGDEVVILVPSDKLSHWAAVENIIKQLEAGRQEECSSAMGSSAMEHADALDKATADLL